ncbi:hypothetical protein D3C87_1341510 [compost metagenome]
MQQHLALQVGGLAHLLRQRGAAHGQEDVRHQPIGVGAAPLAVAEADGAVDVLAPEVHLVERGGEQHLDAGIGRVEAGQPWNQPAHRERRVGAHLQLRAAGAPGQADSGFAQAVHRLGDRAVVVLAGTRERDLPMAAHQ